MKRPLSTLPLSITVLCLVCLVCPVQAHPPSSDSNNLLPFRLADDLSIPPDTGTVRGGGGGGGGTHFKMPSPPSGGTPGGRYKGGASRQGETCPTANLPLTALATTYMQQFQKDSVVNLWGLTTAPHPVFWFYIPYKEGSAYPAVFSLQDENDVDLYRSAIALPNTSGVISVRLPASAPALEVGKSYHWYLKIYCDQQKTPPPISVEGTIQRVNLDRAIASQLVSAPPQQKIELYAQNGIWFDALTTLADLRLAKPQDPILAANWTSLLQSVGLEDVAIAPLTNCCQTK